MQTLLSKIVTACLTTAVLASPAYAAKKDKGQRDATASLQKKLQKADLPTEAREKAEKVVKEYAPKIRDAQAASEAVLTAEQKTARAEAEKKAKEAGTKRKNLESEITAALKLTEEQKPKYHAAQRDLQKAQKDMASALESALTSDQLAKVGLKARKKKNA